MSGVHEERLWSIKMSHREIIKNKGKLRIGLQWGCVLVSTSIVLPFFFIRHPFPFCSSHSLSMSSLRSARLDVNWISSLAQITFTALPRPKTKKTSSIAGDVSLLRINDVALKENLLRVMIWTCRLGRIGNARSRDFPFPQFQCSAFPIPVSLKYPSPKSILRTWSSTRGVGD